MLDFPVEIFYRQTYFFNNYFSINIMISVFKSKAFGAVFLATLIVIFAAFLNLNGTYESRTDVLVIPRSASAVQNSDQIISDLATLPYSLYFYNRMSQDDPAAAISGIQQLPAAQALDRWDSKIRISRVGESGILRITALDQDRSQAETFSFQTAKELISTAGLYYNVRTDIDLRIVDGPITSFAGLAPTYIVFLESLIASFVLVTFAFFISALLFGEKEAPVSKKSVRWAFTGEKTFSPLRREKKEVKLEPVRIKKPEEEAGPAAEIAYTAFTKKAAAPANLPVSDEALSLSVPRSKDNKSIVIPETDESAGGNKEEVEPRKEKPIIREATPEEVKERLNKLLSGKL
jgi:capsular polysaccharide biosynthesis protein